MTDQIPADKVRDLRDQYARLIEDAGTKEAQAYYGHVVKDLEALLPAPPLPTLADMTHGERRECRWMQCDVIDWRERPVIVPIHHNDGTAMVMCEDGTTDTLDTRQITPRPDLPRLEWPGDTPASTPATLTEGSEWGDIDALTTACRESGRDQITVIDTDGDVSVWNGVAGWWQTGTPSDGHEPYTIIHAGKEADQ